ncbi:MAG: flagellar export chaperone FliS [Sphingomonadales bacterium]
MHLAPSPLRAARSHYQAVDLSSRIEGASPHGLVAILFDELLKSLEAMVAACKRKDFGQRGARQAKALAILHGLEISLDVERGGDIAVSLASIYREARRMIIAAARDNDPELLAQTHDMVSDIASAWEAIG